MESDCARVVCLLPLILGHFYGFMQVLYRDLDGSLTGIPGGWVVPNSSLVPDAHCTLSVAAFSSSFNGTVCNAQVQFLRMAWNQAMPLVRGPAWTV